jgi:hypothetical protein
MLFSITKRRSAINLVLVLMTLLAMSSVHAEDIIVKPPAWDCAITQVNADNTTMDSNPVVNTKYLIWEAWDGADHEIFVQRLNTGVVTQITNNNSNDFNPQISGHTVVWLFSNPASNTVDVARHNLKTGTTNIIETPDVSESLPLIEGTYIVWRRIIAGSGDKIGIYDSSTGITSQFGYDDGSFILFGLDDEKLIYRHTTTEGNSFVELYDLATGQIDVLSTGLDIAQADSKQNLAIKNDVVTWRNKTAGHADDAWEIYAYNLATDTLVQVTDDTFEDKTPAVDGNNIVYVKHTGSGYHLYHYELQSGATTLIASSPYQYFEPIIDGKMAAWQGTVGVYVHDLEADRTKTLMNGVQDSDMFIHNNQVYWGGFFAPEQDIYRADCGVLSDEIELPVTSFTQQSTAEMELIPLP